MCTILELLTPGTDKLPFRIENSNAIVALTSPMYRMSDINISFGVHAHTVGIPVADLLGQLTPIMVDLVFVLSLAKNRSSVSGLAGGTDNCSSQRARRGELKYLPT